MRTGAPRDPSRPVIETLESRTLFSADMVMEWNHDMVRAFQTGGLPGPTVAGRDMAIVEVAMSDAVDSVLHRWTPYFVHQHAPRGTSADAAAAGAAYGAMLALFPAERDSLVADLGQSFSEMGMSAPVRKGIAWGQTVATRIVQSRASDGSNASVPYTAGTQPGDWQPDPLNPAQKAFGAGEGQVTPFVLASDSQFRPAPPPSLTSQQYTAGRSKQHRPHRGSDANRHLLGL